MKLSEYDRGWLEAALDGEGSIAFYRHKDKTTKGFRWQLRTQLYNTNRAFLERAKLLIGGRITEKVPSMPNSKMGYTLQVSTRSMGEFLPQLNLIIKERQRLLSLEIIPLLHQNKIARRSINDFRLSEIEKEFRTLNRVGLTTAQPPVKKP